MRKIKTGKKTIRAKSKSRAKRHSKKRQALKTQKGGEFNNIDAALNEILADNFDMTKCNADNSSVRKVFTRQVDCELITLGQLSRVSIIKEILKNTQELNLSNDLIQRIMSQSCANDNMLQEDDEIYTITNQICDVMIDKFKQNVPVIQKKILEIKNTEPEIPDEIYDETKNKLAESIDENDQTLQTFREAVKYYFGLNQTDNSKCQLAGQIFKLSKLLKQITIMDQHSGSKGYYDDFKMAALFKLGELIVDFESGEQNGGSGYLSYLKGMFIGKDEDDKKSLLYFYKQNAKIKEEKKKNKLYLLKKVCQWIGLSWFAGILLFLSPIILICAHQEYLEKKRSEENEKNNKYDGFYKSRFSGK